MDDLAKRRKWFDAYMKCLEQAATAPSQKDSFYTCPVCGYPTLSERGSDEICMICGWEDDGQDDPHANEIWGGPNGDYSLSEARKNFIQYLTMYRPGDESDETNVKKVSLKREVIGAYERMAKTEDSEELGILKKQITELERKLSAV
jgi:hypothetical protein